MSITDVLSLNVPGVRGGPIDSSQESIPTKLSDLRESSARVRCAGCGGSATHSLNTSVGDPSQKGGQRLRRRWSLCEKCATRVIFNLQKALG